MEKFVLSGEDCRLDFSVHPTAHCHVFTCQKCNVRTAGIINEITSNRRFCPSCASPLIICEHERCMQQTSATKNCTGTYCDSCRKEVTDRSLLVDKRHQEL